MQSYFLKFAIRDQIPVQIFNLIQDTLIIVIVKAAISLRPIRSKVEEFKLSVSK